MVREFKLINEKGQEYSLMDIENYCLLTDPSGLGYSYSTEYEQLGNSFISNLRKIEQGQINGTANFLKYDNYKNLVNFIEWSKKIQFSYKIPFENGVKEYLKDVQIQLLAKTEKNTNGVISEQIVFDCLSLWYEEKSTIFKIEPQNDELRWDIKWDSRFVRKDSQSLSFINEGHVAAPILVSMDGSLSNPKIKLYVEGELYQTVEFTAAIEAYEKLLYGTKEDDFYIYRQKTDGTLESLKKLTVIDFDNDNVIRIPVNQSCKIALTADNSVTNAQITILVFYKVI